MKNDYLYYLAAPTSTPPEKIKQIIDIAKKFGFSDVYFYGLDEASGEELRKQRPEWERVHAAGGKVFVAGGAEENLKVMGDLQDLLISHGDVTQEKAIRWHENSSVSTASGFRST